MIGTIIIRTSTDSLVYNEVAKKVDQSGKTLIEIVELELMNKIAQLLASGRVAVLSTM